MHTFCDVFFLLFFVIYYVVYSTFLYFVVLLSYILHVYILYLHSCKMCMYTYARGCNALRAAYYVWLAYTSSVLSCKLLRAQVHNILATINCEWIFTIDKKWWKKLRNEWKSEKETCMCSKIWKLKWEKGFFIIFDWILK